jgi:predicted adenine nucleotide alpha hydrolase (AANH) superfamily ATPase
MNRVRVLDRKGRELSPCPLPKAEAMLAQGRAVLVTEDPPTIQLPYEVDLPLGRQRTEEEKIGEGRSILLHICCGPCSTYAIKRLREEGFRVSGLWYNPNVHPFSEHERRLASLESYVGSVDLPLIGEEGYEMLQFLRVVVGHETYGERCRLCYEMRLTRTAEVAARNGFDAMTTTLLISPHQDQGLIREIGEAVAQKQGVAFHFENLRRGWSERGRMTREHKLYRQQYCGCIYSEWERHAGVDIAEVLSELRDG